MRSVNIGFNVRTSDAVKDLKKFQNELVEIKKLVTDINKKSLDLKIDKNSLSNISKEFEKSAKAIEKSFNVSLTTIDEVIERANRAGDAIGKSAKLDSTTASKYNEKLKEVIRSLEAIKQVDISILDAKEITSLNVSTKQIIKTFNTLERDLDKFTETGVHSTKEVEKLSRKLEYMKKAAQEAFESSGKSSMSTELEKLTSQIDKNIGNLYKSIDNADYKELMKMQEEVKQTSRDYSNFLKLLNTPVKMGAPITLTKPKEGVLYGVEDIKENPSIKSMRRELFELLELSNKLDGILKGTNLKGISTYKTEITDMLKQVSDKSINIGLNDEVVAKLKFNLKELKSNLGDSFKIFDINEKDLDKIDVLKSKLKSISESGKFDIFGRAKKQVEELEGKISDLQKRIMTMGHGSDMPKFQSEIKAVEKELNELYISQMKVSKYSDLGQLINSYTILYGAINLAKKSISNFMELENTVYNLATSSQVGAGGITVLRDSLLQMSTQSAFSAQQLGNAIDDVVRTGQTLSDATKIVNATSKLAMASGEGLSDAVSIVNKIFVALKISANDADEAVQSIHSTAILTSSSLESMGESAKQWIGAVSVFGSLTTKNGKELEDYRLNLMRMGNTFTGILANMGRSGEQSGRLMLCPFVVRTA